MTKEGAGLAVDPSQLVTSLFALIPVPVAIVDDGGRIVLSNSAFSDLFQGIQNIQSIPHHEIEMAGRQSAIDKRRTRRESERRLRDIVVRLGFELLPKCFDFLG